MKKNAARCQILAFLWAAIPTLSALTPTLASPLLPTDKSTISLDPSERNPFALRAPITPQIIQETESEEAQLRTFLSIATIQGYTESDSHRAILLAGRPLRIGDILTDLIPGQTERLLVENILPDRIEFAFLEPENRPPTRRFSIPIQLQPTVRYLLPSQAPAPRSPNLPLQGKFPPPEKSP